MRVKKIVLLLVWLTLLARPSLVFCQTCTPPAENVLTVCSSQGGSSSACQNAIRAANQYCTCMGYAGFSTSTGSCVGKAPTAPPPQDDPPTVFGLPPELAGPAAFSLIGAGIGSTGTKEDMKIGAGGGLLAGAFLAAAVNKSANPVVTSVIAGSGTWVAADAYGKKREAQGLQGPEDTKKQAAVAAGAAAATVGGISLIRKAIGFGWHPPSALRRLKVAATGRGVWVRWSW